MKYIFHCGEYEVEREFKEGTDESYVEESFEDWAFNSGVGCDNLDDMIDSGDAGWYEI